MKNRKPGGGGVWLVGEIIGIRGSKCSEFQLMWVLPERL